MSWRRFATEARRQPIKCLFLVAAACSVLGFLNSTLWMFNLCAQFRLPYIPIFGVATAYFGWRKQFALALSGLVLAVLNTMPILQYWTSTGETAPLADGRGLRVLQMNLWVNNKDYASVVEFIRSQAPDIVAMEEYSAEADKQFGELGLWRDYPFHIATDNNYPSSQIALLSKQKPSSIRIIPTYQNTKDPSIVASMNVGDSAVTIVVMHPRPPAAPQLLARQSNQLNKVASLRNSMDKLVVVAGDLNTTPWAEPLAGFVNAMRVRDSRLGAGPSPTYPTWLPVLPIDYVLCSPEIVVRKFELLGGSGSDHKSILVNLAI